MPLAKLPPPELLLPFIAQATCLPHPHTPPTPSNPPFKSLVPFAEPLLNRLCPHPHCPAPLIVSRTPHESAIPGFESGQANKALLTSLQATIEWEAQEEGFLAKILMPAGSKDIPVGTTVALVVEEEGGEYTLQMLG